jgi:hypothetical protein
MKLAIVTWNPYTKSKIKSAPWGLGHADLAKAHRMFVGPDVDLNLQGMNVHQLTDELIGLGFAEVDDYSTWISVERELPPADVMVWGCLRTGPAYNPQWFQITVMRTSCGWAAIDVDGHFYSIGEPGDEVTHWRPLPDMPEENHEA